MSEQVPPVGGIPASDGASFGKMGMAAALGSTLRTGNPMIDMFVMMIVMTLVTKLVGSIDQIIILLQTIAKFIAEWIAQRGKKMLKTNTLTIERSLDKQEHEANNKIMIDAILNSVDNGKTYQLVNRAVQDKYSNDFEREIARKMFLRIDEGFVEDGIHVKHETVTKKIQKAVKDEYGKAIGDKVNEVTIPIKEVLTLTSNTKTLKEMQTYVKEKRDAYIRKTCSHNDTIAIYVPTLYGDSYLEFHKREFRSGKSMTSWFVPDSAKIEQVVDNFINKEGIYKLPSTQWKLGFLLHGEPGCGKSSFIKVLANKLHRHVFPISLKDLQNINSLQRLFYEDYVWDRKKEKWDYIPIDKRIIVFEEIDTAGEVVMDRKKLRDMKKHKPSVFASKFSSYGFYQAYQSDFRTAKIKKKTENKKKKVLTKRRELEIRRKNILLKQKLEDKRNELLGKKNITELKEAEKLEIEEKVSSHAEYLKATTEFKVLLEDEDSDIEEDDDLSDDDDGDMNDLFDRSLDKKSNLNLGDLLTIFDGIHELNGLVYVMTTNHRDYLDPALIRPGRITCEIELKKMRASEITRMLTYYYIEHNCHNETTTEQVRKKQIADIAHMLDGRCKPSKVEVLCQQNTLTKFFKLLPELNLQIQQVDVSKSTK